MEFKKGNLVLVKQLVLFGIYDDYIITEPIVRLGGKKVRIKKVCDDGSYQVYGLPTDTHVTNSMLEDMVFDEELICSKCGKADQILDDLVFDAMGQPYCSDCATDMIVTCSCCGGNIDKMHEDFIELDGKLYCQDCIETKLARCDKCNKYHLIDDMGKLDDNKYICNSCIYTYDYEYCAECGKYHKSDYFTVFDGTKMCNRCADKVVSNSIGCYHSFSDWEKRSTSCSNVLETNFIGSEIEVENARGNISNNLAAYKATKMVDKLIACEHDGSLDDGFEMISHPMTMDYMRTVAKDKFNSMFKYLADNGFKSHDTSSCGLHFHVGRECLGTPNRNESEVIDNILLIMETFKKELQKFARRSDTGYSRFLTSGEKSVYMKTVKKIKNTAERDRYVALNLTNDNTIEFRIFRGTLKFETYMASMELVNNIVNIAKHCEINGLSWEDIINYNNDTNEYIVTYNTERGITSDTKVYVLSPIELMKDELTVENFLKDKFSIEMERTDSKNMYILAGILLANNVQCPNSFGNILDAVNYHYNYRNSVHITKKGGKYNLTQKTTVSEVLVSLSDLIELWVSESKSLD